ncbi:YrdB family protein [Kitasatospora sp. NA04385]|uniref:YrdB family protein n=1 Tax=Kitasatospora sp. NA04385 TaxID=2742135 RepID=UPI00158FB5FF|nr:YrdB family protein [Kitasatospora sp. NA04385]QKW23496.1 YrdB family protein [Kitasatospora sp. NA04385]
MTGAQLALRFLLELASLVALAVGGYGAWSDGPVALRVLLALVLPALAIVLWARYAAPRRKVREPVALWYGVQLLVWGGSVVLLAIGGHPWWALGLGVVMVANTVVLRALGEWSPAVER